MVAAPLVESYIDSGRQLVTELDKSNFPLSAALWLFLEEVPHWRLILASSTVDEVGKREAYNRVQQIILQRHIPIELRDISIVSPRDQLIELLRTAVPTGPGISGIRFTRNAINGTFIDDAYIYRVN